MSTPWGDTRGNRARAEYLARQGLALGSIRRMVKYEFGICPCDKQIQKMIEAEQERRARLKRRYA